MAIFIRSGIATLLGAFFLLMTFFALEPVMGEDAAGGIVLVSYLVYIVIASPWIEGMNRRGIDGEWNG